MKTIEINGTLREETGSKSAKNGKRTGNIPCVVYGGEKNMHFTVTKNDVKDLIYTSTLHKANIALEKDNIEAIVKDLQFDPLTDEITHMDFQELVDGKIILIDIPVKVKGTAKGVKNGGKLMEKMRYIKVKCTPESLIGNIEVNVKKLKIGQSIRVRDLEVEGVEFMDSGSNPIVSVGVTRAAMAGGEFDDEFDEEGGTTEGVAEGSPEGGEKATAEQASAEK
jgi:large subunit ribosomal protein L25